MKHTDKQFFFPTTQSIEAQKMAQEMVQSQPVSKSVVANAIFKQMFGMMPVPPRKDMIQRAIKEAGLTEKGAATYLQNYKSKNGLTKPKVTA